MKNNRNLLVEDHPDHPDPTLMTLAENNVPNEVVVASDGLQVCGLLVHQPLAGQTP